MGLLEEKLSDDRKDTSLASIENKLKKLLTKDEKTIKFFSDKGFNLLTSDGKIDKEKIMKYNTRGRTWEDGSYRSPLYFEYEAEDLIRQLQSTYGYKDFVDRLTKI